MEEKCAYHPDVDAKDKCERCHRLICLSDTMKHRVTRSSGTSENRTSWSEDYTYCPACYYDAKIDEAKPKPVAVIFLVVPIGMFGFAFFMMQAMLGEAGQFGGPPPAILYGFFGFFFLILSFFIATAVKMVAGSPGDVEEYQQKQEEFFRSVQNVKGIEFQSNTSGWRKSSKLMVNCRQCGNLLDLKEKFCSNCGDTTSDEREVHGI